MAANAPMAGTEPPPRATISSLVNLAQCSINIMIRKFSEYIHDFYNFKQSWAEGKSL